MKSNIITKKMLVEKIAEKENLSQLQVNKIISQFFTQIEDSIRNGNEIAITGYMSFKVRDVAERKAKNPRTGETITIPARKRVFCKLGKKITCCCQ